MLRPFLHLLAAMLLTLGCASGEDTGRDADDSPPADSQLADADSQPADPTTPAAAAAVIQRYYDAIDRHAYAQAYDAWESDGAASGQTFDEFRAGFAETASVEVEIGPPGRIGAAAGSRYIEIPVVVTATTTDGALQRFEGHYVLRRAVVDGATPEQRAWHIYSAELAERR